MGRDSVSRYDSIVAALLAKAAISVHQWWCAHFNCTALLGTCVLARGCYCTCSAVALHGQLNSRAMWLAGEQQRIGMARLFFHKPKFGVLDECTNATSVDVEEHLYQYAAQLGITLVTITQRLALVKYHDAELRLLDGEGDWELRQIVK